MLFLAILSINAQIMQEFLIKEMSITSTYHQW